MEPGKLENKFSNYGMVLAELMVYTLIKDFTDGIERIFGRMRNKTESVQFGYIYYLESHTILKGGS